MITGNTGTAQLPMKKRAENVLAELVKRKGIRRHFIEEKVLKHMLKKGMVKLEKDHGWGATHTRVVPMNMPPIKEEEVREPYKKRKEALDEAGLNYRGKKSMKEEAKDLTKDLKVAYAEYKYDFVLGGSRPVKAGVYRFKNWPVNLELIAQAQRVWGVTNEGKTFYIKQRATNPKSNFLDKKAMKEFAWVKLQARDF